MARTLSAAVAESFAANIGGVTTVSRDMAWGDAEKTNNAPFVVGSDKTLASVTASSSSSFGNWIARLIVSRNSESAFIESTTVLANTLTVTAHGYLVNDAVTFVGDGDLPLPLQYGIVYYVESVPTLNTFTLAYTVGGTTINITTQGIGNINIEPADVVDLVFGQTNASVVSMTATSNQVVVIGHGLTVGDAVQFSGTGELASPLEFGITYFVESVINVDTFTLSGTPAGSLLDLTSNSSGSLELNYQNQGLITSSPGIGVVEGDSIRLRFVSQGSSINSPQMEFILF